MDLFQKKHACKNDNSSYMGKVNVSQNGINNIKSICNCFYLVIHEYSKLIETVKADYIYAENYDKLLDLSQSKNKINSTLKNVQFLIFINIIDKAIKMCDLNTIKDYKQNFIYQDELFNTFVDNIKMISDDLSNADNSLIILLLILAEYMNGNDELKVLSDILNQKYDFNIKYSKEEEIATAFYILCYISKKNGLLCVMTAAEKLSICYQLHNTVLYPRFNKYILLWLNSEPYPSLNTEVGQYLIMCVFNYLSDYKYSIRKIYEALWQGHHDSEYLREILDNDKTIKNNFLKPFIYKWIDSFTIEDEFFNSGLISNELFLFINKYFINRVPVKAEKKDKDISFLPKELGRSYSFMRRHSYDSNFFAKYDIAERKLILAEIHNDDFSLEPVYAVLGRAPEQPWYYDIKRNCIQLLHNNGLLYYYDKSVIPWSNYKVNIDKLLNEVCDGLIKVVTEEELVKLHLSTLAIVNKYDIEGGIIKKDNENSISIHMKKNDFMIYTDHNNDDNSYYVVDEVFITSKVADDTIISLCEEIKHLMKQSHLIKCKV